MNEKNEMMKKAMADEAFVKALLEAENEEAVQKLFADKGVEITTEEIGALRDGMVALLDDESKLEQLQKAAEGELSDDDLEAVAGGYSETGAKVAFFGMLGLITAGVAVYKGCEAGGIDLGEKIQSGYTWVKDNITRW